MEAHFCFCQPRTSHTGWELQRGLPGKLGPARVDSTGYPTWSRQHGTSIERSIIYVHALRTIHTQKQLACPCRCVKRGPHHIKILIIIAFTLIQMSILTWKGALNSKVQFVAQFLGDTDWWLMLPVLNFEEPKSTGRNREVAMPLWNCCSIPRKVASVIWQHARTFRLSWAIPTVLTPAHGTCLLAER